MEYIMRIQQKLEIKMHKITTPKNLSASPSRAFSFSQQQPQSSCSIDVNALNTFMDSLERISMLHDEVPKLSRFLLINSTDANAVQHAIQTDSTLTLQLKQRMGKYLGVVSNLNQDIWGQKENVGQGNSTNQKQEDPHIRSDSNLSTTPNINKVHEESHFSRENSQQIQNFRQKTANNKKLSTSRYTTTINEPLQNVSIEIKKYKPNKNYSNSNLNSDHSQNGSNNRSVSNSQASQSKSFHQIQLKSVKKVGKCQEKQEKKPYLKKQKSEANKTQQLFQQFKHQQAGRQQKRYTISQRDKKGEKSLSFQVNNMKSNSRLRASRVVTNQDQQKNISMKSRISNSKSIPKRCYENSSPNRHLECISSPPTNLNSKLMGSRLQTENKDILGQLDIQSGVRIGMSNNNIVMETVQKSNDFLQMLRMMNDT